MCKSGCVPKYGYVCKSRSVHWYWYVCVLKCMEVGNCAWERKSCLWNGCVGQGVFVLRRAKREVCVLRQRLNNAYLVDLRDIV